jgi:hypothetical protein
MSHDLREVNGNIWTTDLVGAHAAARGSESRRGRRRQRLRDPAVYERSTVFWGTFTDTPGDSYLAGRVPAQDPWRARVDFYGAHGRLATLRIRLNRPGFRVFGVR